MPFQRKSVFITLAFTTLSNYFIYLVYKKKKKVTKVAVFKLNVPHYSKSFHK